MPYKDPARQKEWMTSEERKRYSHAYYESNKDKWENEYSEWRREHRTWLHETQSFLGCFICGEDRPWRLVWHHMNPKDKVLEISTMVQTQRDLRGALDEMGRCVVLCCNCHADVHYRMET